MINQTMATRALRSALPMVAFDPSEPLNAQLTASLRDAVRQGRLAPGWRLPPTREAARQWGVGRNTVVDAYSELAAEGLLEPRGRLGTYVAPLVERAEASPTARPLVVRRMAHTADGIVAPARDWRLGQSGAQLLPLNVWRTACREAGRHLPPSGYGDPRGVAGLRESIAIWLQRHRGTQHDAQQIIVTQGTGAALELLARVLVRPGDLCAVESPGYPRATAAFASAGGTVRPVPVDGQGMLVGTAFAGRAPTVLHLTPAHQYPAGGRLSGARRAELAGLVAKHGSLVIENEYDHEFIYEGQNHAALAAVLRDHTVLVSTFAKAVSPALRIGFVAAPVAVADALAQAVERDRLHASWPVQISLQWLLVSGELQRHLRRVRRHHASQRDRLLVAIKHACPDLHLRGHEGGLHVVLSTGDPTGDARLSERLRRRGVALQTLKDFGGSNDEVLLSYGHMSPRDIEQAVDILKTCCRVRSTTI